MATSSWRFFLVILGRRIACEPFGVSKLTRAVEEREGAFHTRDTLAGPLVFTDATFQLLYGLERSRDRCTPLALISEHRTATGWQQRHRGYFTLSDCTFNVPGCEVSVTPKTDDGYRLLYNNWEKKINILAYPGPRITLTTTIKELPASDTLEFTRIDRIDQASEFVGRNGWSEFLTNKSHLGGRVRDRTMILFRLSRRGVPFVLDSETQEMVPPDLSSRGYELDEDWLDDGTKETADYVKTVEISGFKPYVIGTYRDWGSKYGPDLVLTECSAPAPGKGYIKITGAGPYLANNAECPTCLNVKRSVNKDSCKAVWWRYGAFRFTRCFPLLEGLHYVLQQTVPSLCPPSAAQLSRFFTDDKNAATGESGAQNEVTRLYLSAASDVKRPGASEPATRLSVTGKDLLTGLATCWDAGWFIDEQTGFLRLEHRAWLEERTIVPLDMREGGYLEYSYLQQQMPRVERLQITNAQTVAGTVDFAEGGIRYDSPCVNSEEGQNEAVRSVSLLTGDIRALLLSGGSLPDQALCVLVAAPPIPLEPTRIVENGNLALSASQLLKRYHRRGRVLRAGVLLPGEEPVIFDSVRPAVKLEPHTPTGCHSVEETALRRKLLTVYGPDGTLREAVEDLITGSLTVSALHVAPEVDLPYPGLPRQFNATHFNPEHFA